MKKLAIKVKQLFNVNNKASKRKEAGQDLLECLDYAKQSARAEYLSVLRGKITQSEFESDLDDIAQRHYNKLKLRIRLMVSLKKFRQTLKLEIS
jgi:hypothetical protein